MIIRFAFNFTFPAIHDIIDVIPCFLFHFQKVHGKTQSESTRNTTFNFGSFQWKIYGSVSKKGTAEGFLVTSSKFTKRKLQS